MNYRIGAKQRDILSKMNAGFSLEQDGWGFFHLVKDGRETRVSDASCQGLHQRGLIGESKREVHSGYVGGVRVWYALTEQGKDVV